jgi:TolB-like protein/tRNA A-37 threonylcarbamoyl transferase component Bud32/lipoprotein NlpI
VQLDHLKAALADRYPIEREIGRGATTIVYLAHDQKHDRKVAVKVLQADLTLALRTQRFLREIRIAAKLSHPHILPLYDSGEVAGALYYVTPYVEGESLRDRLTRERQLPVEEALRIARDVATALSYAHDHSVVHRDVKPENILLAAGSEAVVADFGIARALSMASGGTQTPTGVTLGTPAYMSPEQAAGSREQAVDGRSDVYSLGCVLYEMLAGHPPFDGATPQELLARHALDPVPSLKAARPGVPDHLEHTIAKALAKVPTDRFRTMAQFVDALGGAEGGRRQRRRRVPAAVVAATAGGIGALLATGWFVSPFLSGPQTDLRRYQKAVAVLYFDDASPEPADRRFGEGLTEELISRLATIRALRVVPRIDVLRYKSSPASTHEIARQLGVDAILTGTIRTAGTDFRVTAQLIDAKQGFVTSSWDYQGQLQRIFFVQDEITNRIVSALNLSLSRGEQQRIGRNPAADFQAYQLFLQGEVHLTRWTDAAVDTAISLFQAAVQRDHAFPDAYAHLAFAQLVQMYFGMASDERTLQAIKENGDRALGLDPDNEVAMISVAGYYLLKVRRGDRLSLLQSRELIVQLKRLVARNPHSALGTLGLAYYYLFRHDVTRAKPLFQDAWSYADAAVRVEPNDQFMRGMAAQATGLLASLLDSEGNSTGAIELTERSLEYVPSVTRTYNQLSHFYARAGQHDRAVAAVERGLRYVRTPEDSADIYVLIGSHRYQVERFADAAASFATAVSLLDRVGGPMRDDALLYWVILERRLGHAVEANRRLAARAVTLDRAALGDRVIAFYTGHMTEADVVGAARKDWQKGAAYYFLGAQALYLGQRDDARRYFEQSVATGGNDEPVYFSRLELTLLSRNGPRERSAPD